MAVELAVQASSSYFDAFQQEKLRRAVVSTLGVRDERVVDGGVLSTNIGQVLCATATHNRSTNRSPALPYLGASSHMIFAC